MKVLVTGGAGFIGSHLVDRLIYKKYKVAVVDDLSGGRRENLNKSALFYQCDVRNWPKIDKIFAEFKPETVFHLAANAAENKAQFSPVDTTSRNFDGSVKTVTAAIRHGLRRFIFASSIAVYGGIQTPFLENSVPEPEDLYGITKLAFENCLKVLSKVHRFEYVIVRPHNVYGPRQNMRDPYRNVVTIFMNALLHNKPYYIYGDGRQRRCFTYVGDVVDALAKCAVAPVANKTFNLGSDKDYSLNALSDLVLKACRSELQPVYLPARPQEVKIAVSDHSLSKKLLTYQDKVPLEEGLTETWQWVKSQGYQKPKYDGIEIDSQLMPKNWKIKP